MQAVGSIETRIPAKSRLSMRLALLFVGTFLGVLIMLMAWTMFATLADRRQVAATSDVAAPVIVIDPKIQSDLAKALAFDALPATGEVLNPFIDRAGLSGTVLATNMRASSPATASSSPTAATSTTTVAGPAGRVPSSRMSITQIAPAAYAYSVKERHDDWLDRQKRGEFVGPESEILVVEDLVPVGFASGGDRAAEVMLYSVSLCQTFSFPAGTRLANGWISGFDQTEVVFTIQDGIRRKSYSNGETCQANNAEAAN